MTRFYIIRHGETKGTHNGRYHGLTDISLNSLGKSQAKNLNKMFKKIPINYIYTSPMKRCIETANIIKAKRNIPIIKSGKLREIHFGKWEDLTLNEMYKQNPNKFNKWMNNFYRFQMPDGEKVKDLIKRVGIFWKYITQKHKRGNVILVTHGGPVKTIIMKALGISWKHFWSFQIDTCSINVIDCIENYTVVKKINNQIK